MWVAFSLILRFGFVKFVLWCRSLGFFACVTNDQVLKSCLCVFLVWCFFFFPSLKKFQQQPECQLKSSQVLLGNFWDKWVKHEEASTGNSHFSWRMMYECVETLSKTCFFSNVQGLVTTKCVMSVVKNSFFHSCLPFWSFFSFMSIHKLQASSR